MAKSQRIIDYLDVEMSLAGLPAAAFKKWLEQFVEEQKNVEGRPKIKQGFLQLNSTDLIAFLGCVDSETLSELELKRLAAAARREYERLLFNSVALDHQYHYKWCLAALKSLPIGRRRTKLPAPIQLAPRMKKKPADKKKTTARIAAKRKKKSDPD